LDRESRALSAVIVMALVIGLMTAAHAEESLSE
jgi:hypothetical protein